MNVFIVLFLTIYYFPNFQVVHGDPPRLEHKDPVTGRTFTLEFVNFVNTCLAKEETHRPKYVALLKDPFIKRADAEASSVNMAGYVNDVLERYTDAVDAMEVDFPSDDATSTLKWN